VRRSESIRFRDLTMTLVMTILVRDEEDILTTNLEHHFAAGVDHVIATDNLSTDGTTDLLRAYEAAGHLTLINETGDDYSQARWVTRMARLAATEFGADWIINNDADEFWWAPDHDLPALLDAVPDDVHAVRAQRANFIARPDDDQPFWQRMTIRQQPAQPHPGMDWPTLGPKVCHRGHADVHVAQGNHDVRFGSGPLVDPTDDTPLEILHFPVRSRRRFENKVVLGGAAYARNTELPVEAGKIWRDLYAVHQDGAFDDAYSRCVLSAETVAAGLAADTLVEDSRLLERLTQLGLGRPTDEV
jgi:hypothetical protein